MTWFNWTDFPFMFYVGWRIGIEARVRWEMAKLNKELNDGDQNPNGCNV